eukprot:scaffold46640_cov17-Tisochrysis_lutea.AAC.1
MRAPSPKTAQPSAHTTPGTRTHSGALASSQRAPASSAGRTSAPAAPTPAATAASRQSSAAARREGERHR